MIVNINHKNTTYLVDLSKPIDISIPIDVNTPNINAWYIDDPKIYPEKFNDQALKVSEGSSVNFNSIHFNPHSHVTHTECVGHITEKVYSVNQYLQQFFFLAEVVSITPEKHGNDTVITKDQLTYLLKDKQCEALVIRTLPNSNNKKSKRYSNTNPTYLLEDAAIYLREIGIEHLLIDLPSVDKEKDDGLLLSHNAFWNTQGEIRLNATITEFIYVPTKVIDGTYFLNLMIAPFHNDATPSKPILYAIDKN